MSLTGNAEGKAIHGNINRLNEIRGYSAYEVALLNGFKGTEAEWLASLKGDKGEKGDTYTLTEADKTEIAAIATADIDTALDNIIAIQNSLIGGDSE